MESVLAIGVGLALRVVVDAATDNDNRVGGVLVGLWEGVVLNHFVQKMPRSFDPYIGLGFRVFVDFLFTQSISRMALVALWTVVGMLLADVAPSVWHDSGLRRIYRRVRKDVRHIKRAVPDIRIKNDIPTPRFLSRTTRATSTVVSGSIRSDRAAPARSPAPPPAPIPGPSRRPGRSPPGAFPDYSGWSETETEVTALRDRRDRDIMTPIASPALIPTNVVVERQVADTTHVRTPTARTTPLPTTITQTQNETVLLETVVTTAAVGTAASTLIEPIDDPSRHNPLTIPDDWINVTPPLRPQSNAPIFEFPQEPQPGPSTFSLDSQPRPASIVVPTPRLDVLPNIPDIDLGGGDRRSRGPQDVPLPESRAASVIGGVFDQPRSVWRENVLARVDKATSDIGIDPSRPYAPFVATQAGPHIRSGSTGWTRSKLKHGVDEDAPEVPPKAATTKAESVIGGKAESVSGKTNRGGVQDSEPPTPTPTQPNPPVDTFNLHTDTKPLSPTEPEPPVPQTPAQPAPNDNEDADASAPQPVVDSAAAAGPSRQHSMFDVDPVRTPPPPFSEFDGVDPGPAAGEGPAAEDPVTQDEEPTKLTEDQKAAEEIRANFLLKEVTKLQVDHMTMQEELEAKGGKSAESALAIKNVEKRLADLKARITKKRFSDAPAEPEVIEINAGSQKDMDEVGNEITTAIVDSLLQSDHPGPICVQASISKATRPLKNKPLERKDAIVAFVKENKFSFKTPTPGVILITA